MKRAFTLAEVLITLVVIGIVAAITVPVIMNKYKWAQYRSAAIKAKSTLDNLVRKYYVDEGTNTFCHASVVGVDNRSECRKLYEYFVKNLNVAKYCQSQAYNNGCIPDYDGIDTVYSNKNPDKTAEEVKENVSSVLYFSKSYIQAGSAIVTTEGMIFVPYSAGYVFTPPRMMVDINGAKGPNKWGHDIISFIFENSSTLNKFESPYFKPMNSDTYVDKGGKTTYKLIYGKNVVD